jgi:hypothetical protein
MEHLSESAASGRSKSDMPAEERIYCPVDHLSETFESAFVTEGIWQGGNTADQNAVRPFDVALESYTGD